MRANYGYADGSGEYYLTVDTDLCDGCGLCVPACSKGVLEVVPDDYDEPKAMMRAELARSLAQVCLGFKACSKLGTNCHAACPKGALEHTW